MDKSKPEPLLRKITQVNQVSYQAQVNIGLQLEVFSQEEPIDTEISHHQDQKDVSFEYHHRYIVKSTSPVRISNLKLSQNQLNLQSKQSLANIDNTQKNKKFPLFFNENNSEIYLAEYLDDEDHLNTQVNTQRSQKNRKRIFSGPPESIIQPNRVSESKHRILQLLNSRQDISTFIAFQLKPNLALLRNKGFYELSKAEDYLKNSLEKDYKKPRYQFKLPKIDRQDYLQKPNVVKLSQILLNRSNSIVARVQSEQKEIEKPSVIIVPKTSKEQDMIKLIKKIDLLKEKNIDQEQKPFQQINLQQQSPTPINKQFYQNMKRKIRKKQMNSQQSKAQLFNKDTVADQDIISIAHSFQDLNYEFQS